MICIARLLEEPGFPTLDDLGFEGPRLKVQGFSFGTFIGVYMML